MVLMAGWSEGWCAVASECGGCEAQWQTWPRPKRQRPESRWRAGQTSDRLRIPKRASYDSAAGHCAWWVGCITANAGGVIAFGGGIDQYGSPCSMVRLKALLLRDN